MTCVFMFIKPCHSDWTSSFLVLTGGWGLKSAGAKPVSSLLTMKKPMPVDGWSIAPTQCMLVQMHGVIRHRSKCWHARGTPRGRHSIRKDRNWSGTDPEESSVVLNPIFMLLNQIVLVPVTRARQGAQVVTRVGSTWNPFCVCHSNSTRCLLCKMQ